jgi:hypothetical protein
MKFPPALQETVQETDEVTGANVLSSDELEIMGRSSADLWQLVFVFDRQSFVTGMCVTLSRFSA